MKSRVTFVDVTNTALLAAGLLAGSIALRHLSDGLLREWADEVLLGVAVFIPLVTIFTLLEHVVPAVPHKPARDWILNFRICLLFICGLQAANVLGLALAAILARHFPLGWIDLRFAEGGSVGAVLAASFVSLFIGDFFYYWWHRFQHRSVVLWQQHKLHHMDEHVNVLTQYRADWLEPTSALVLTYFPLVFLFRLDSLTGLAATLNTIVVIAWAVFFHANIRLGLGRCGVLLAGPQVHRIHHSILPEHRDRNFAALFPIWDLLFGTYHHPAPGEFPPTGVTTEPEVRTVVEAVTLPFRGWRQILRQRSRRASSG